MILMLKFKPEQSKILMISRKKVFRVFDRHPHSLHTGGPYAGGRELETRYQTVCRKWGVIRCRFRVIGLFVSQLRISSCRWLRRVKLTYGARKSMLERRKMREIGIIHPKKGQKKAPILRRAQKIPKN
jgi:hypothetical protein